MQDLMAPREIMGPQGPWVSLVHRVLLGRQVLLVLRVLKDHRG